jgi:hypothetical protein
MKWLSIRFKVNGARNHIAAGQVFDLGGVLLHEALATAIEQNAALAAHALGDEEAGGVEASGVELVKLHIFQRDAAPVANGGTIAGEAVGVAGYFPAFAPTTGSKHDSLAMKNVDLAIGNANGHHANGFTIFHQQIDDVVFIEKVDVVLDTLLVQRLQNHMAGAVGGMAGAANWLAGIGVGVATKTPLRYFAGGGAVEGQAHML